MTKTPALQSRVTGEGSPLVLIGGGLTGWLGWDPYVEGFSQSRKVVQLQQMNVQWAVRGEPFPADYSVKTESRGIAAALDGLGLTGPTDIVAWSYGALVALDFALDEPERVRTLTLIEPPAWWVLRELGTLDADAREEEEFFKGFAGEVTEEQLESFLRRVGLEPPGGSVRDLPQWPLWVQHRQALVNNQAILEQRDDLDRLRRLTAPVLLVKGDGSAAMHHRMVDAIAERLPESRVLQLPGGHAPHIVAKERFLEALAEFQAGAAAP